ncbi:cysteine proteinase [Annulohypoxylon nitens]|nr:cysteine proteinase [Annulohypoxylon nitens]
MSSVAFTKTSVAPGPGAKGTGISPMTNRGHGPGGSPGAGKAPYCHIEDLVSVGVDLDPHTPLRKVLEIGDAHMRQAMTYNDFRRPDLALQEYIKAFTIAVDKVPRHKDYPTLKSDPGQLNRLYNALKTKITTNGAIFDKIKEDIKEDNRRSGVEPTSSPSVSAELTRMQLSNAPPATISQARMNGSTGIQSNGTQNEVGISSKNGNTNDYNTSIRVEPKGKPPVQPKPRALHGNAIHQTSKASPEDLASRFARLRDSQKSGKSDNPPKFPSVNTSMPAMPKLPEAIYSPARGTVTSEVANLPSSTPRGMFSRTNSITSTPTIPTCNSTENMVMAVSREQFATAQSYYTSQPPFQASQVKIPQGETIAAATLANLMARNVQILLIDVRDRRSFDDGHIRSPRTICVEPEILMRENISADEIADSMVLAPPNEKLAIEQRDKVDLVVIYDQESAYVPTRITGDSREMILHNIRQALSHYSYSRPLKNSPKLLNGGLASWLNEFGEISLETSDTASKRVPLSSARSRTKTKTLSQDEIDRFEGLIQEDRTGIPDFDYVKSRDDFVRRYPSIGGAPESMITPAHEELNMQQQEFISGMALAPPRRPAPAVPRTRYSGLDSRDDGSDFGALAMRHIPMAQGARNAPRTGLYSTGNSCYCNSTVQALLHSPGFIDELLASNWPEVWRRNEGDEPYGPQLLCKILKNLLRWLHAAQFKTIRPSTLIDYIGSISERYSAVEGVIRLGDGEQHDVHELLSLFETEIRGETDLTLNHLVEDPKIPPNSSPMVKSALTRLLGELKRHSTLNFMDRHFGLTKLVSLTCGHCNETKYVPDFQTHIVYHNDAQRSNILDTFKSKAHTGEPSGWTCDCGIKGAAISREPFLSFPPLLRINISKHKYDPYTKRHTKELRHVNFPYNLDLTGCAVDLQVRQEFANLMPEPYNKNFVAPCEYELYAIQIHEGATATSGHYWTFVRTEVEDTWILLEDANVKYIEGNEWRQTYRDMLRCRKDRAPVVIWYKRKDIPWNWKNQPKAKW